MARFPDPVIRGAEEGTPTNTPTSCSTECPCSDADEVIPKQVKPLSETMMAVERKLPSTSMVAQVVFEGIQQRYIATATCSLRPFLWGSAIEVLEAMTVQNMVLLDPLHAHGIDKEQWPPLFACKILLIGNIQRGLHFWPVVSLGLTFNCGQKIVKHNPPWPPPTHWILLIVNAQLRPIPWPSFCCYTVALQLEDFLILIGQRMYLKLIGSEHTMQVISVICAIGFRAWSTSFTLEIHINVYDSLLLSSSFIFWADVCWLLFTCHYEPVQWKLSWLFVLWTIPEVQTWLCCIVVQCKVPWKPPDRTWSSYYPHHDWYLMQQNGFGIWSISTEKLQLLLVVVGTTSGIATSMHLQAFRVSRLMFKDNWQLNWIQWEIAWPFVCYYAVSDQKALLWCLVLLVQQQFSDVLLTGIILLQQWILWKHAVVPYWPNPFLLIVSAWKYWYGHCILTPYCQSFTVGDSSAIVCCEQWLTLLKSAVQVWDTEHLPPPLPGCQKFSSPSCKLTVHSVLSKLKMEQCLHSESEMWLLPEILVTYASHQVLHKLQVGTSGNFELLLQPWSPFALLSYLCMFVFGKSLQFMWHSPQLNLEGFQNQATVGILQIQDGPLGSVIKLQIIPMKSHHSLEQAMGRMTLQLMQFFHQDLDDP